MGFLRRHRILTALTLVFLLLLGMFVATAVAVWKAAHHDEARSVSRVDLIVVLGAAQYSGRPSPVFEGRLQHAALLYRRGFAPRVLVVGAGQEGDVTTEAESGRDWLVSEGIPGSDVQAEPVGGTTLESLRGAASFMRREGLRSAFLVSDPWHNLRMRRMARDLGIEAYVSATWHSAAQRQWTRLSGYSRETFAYLYYRVLGR